MDELDRILSSEEPLSPSSGFSARVMDAVREAAIEPPPLPFPWGRFAAGAIASMVCTGSGVGLAAQVDGSVAGAIVSQLAPVGTELAYALLAVLVVLGALQLQNHRRSAAHT